MCLLQTLRLGHNHHNNNNDNDDDDDDDAGGDDDDDDDDDADPTNTLQFMVFFGFPIFSILWIKMDSHGPTYAHYDPIPSSGSLAGCRA